MVPMAPSSTMMRSAARLRSVFSLADWISINLRPLGLDMGMRFPALLFAGP